MTPITIKDSTSADVVFSLIRQPAGSMSGILRATIMGAGMNQTAYPKIELMAKHVKGRAEPVVSVTVPYGAVINGNFVAEGQVVHLHQSRLPPTAPDKARLDAEAFARNCLANVQVQALFQNGVLS